MKKCLKKIFTKIFPSVHRWTVHQPKTQTMTTYTQHNISSPSGSLYTLPNATDAVFGKNSFCFPERPLFVTPEIPQPTKTELLFTNPNNSRGYFGIMACSDFTSWPAHFQLVELWISQPKYFQFSSAEICVVFCLHRLTLEQRHVDIMAAINFCNFTAL